ncbi:MAG: hypothetical protein JWO94_235 [Verrucomicrobiaceae bacterium]|nr:hypothetical protein [Verrucomicrobiaceae bacterium]
MMHRWSRLFVLAVMAALLGWFLAGKWRSQPLRPLAAAQNLPGARSFSPLLPTSVRGTFLPSSATTKALDEKISPVTPTGAFSKLRLIETKGHRLIRQAEEWQKGVSGEQDQLNTRAEMVADRLVVKMRDGQSLAGLTAWAKSLGLAVLRPLPGTPFIVLQLPDADVQRFDQWLARLNQAGLPVEYAEPDLIRHASGMPDDLHFAEQWALHNAGQTGGKPGADVHALEAWDISTGSPSVVVAVLDTGIDRTHPDLKPNLWINPGEIDGNNKDDDGDGYVD